MPKRRIREANVSFREREGVSIKRAVETKGGLNTVGISMTDQGPVLEPTKSLNYFALSHICGESAQQNDFRKKELFNAVLELILSNGHFFGYHL